MNRIFNNPTRTHKGRGAIFFVLAALICISCSRPSAQSTSVVVHPPFDGDSAYAYVTQQVSFGSRVPGSDEHEQCLRWLAETLERLGAIVEIQVGSLPRYDGELQPIRNIIGHLQADSATTLKKPILLSAHYDSRPWADQEDNYTDRQTPILGANDGASGVGVLLEVARQWALLPEHKQPVDIVFFDCEDMGTPDFYTGQQREHTWCLGAQLWARDISQKSKVEKRKTVAKRRPYEFGILLDMVGDPNATFPREYYSEQFAGEYVRRIWRTAEQLGYTHRFTNSRAYPITDDHYYVNTIADIPCVDIIHYDANGQTGFPWWWHTQQDDMRNISPNTLREVGEVIMTVINY